jgi:four helix bundle protein
MAGGVRDLKVWQEAVALAGDIVRAARQSARRETKAVMDAVALTALAVATHIADGYGQYTVPEQRQLYRTAKRELLRLETQIAVLRHAELLSHQMHAELLKRIHTVARLLAGYVVYLERQRISEDDDGASSPASSSATSAS